MLSSTPLSPRHSGIKNLLFLLLLSLCSSAFAQTNTKEIPKFTLSATQVGDFKLPQLYYLMTSIDSHAKLQQDYLPLGVTCGTRGSTSAISLVSPVKIYTGTFSAAGVPQMQPYLDVPVKTAKDRLLLVFHLDRDGRVLTTFLDDSETAHPAGSIRLVNFGTEQVAFSAGAAVTSIAPGGEGKAAPVVNADKIYPFVLYVGQSGQNPKPQPTALMRVSNPRDRVLILYTMIPADIPTGQVDATGKAITKKGYTPIAYRIYDRI